MKTSQKYQCSKASNSVLMTSSFTVRRVKSLSDYIACNLVVATTVFSYSQISNTYFNRYYDAPAEISMVYLLICTIFIILY